MFVQGVVRLQADGVAQLTLRPQNGNGGAGLMMMLLVMVSWLGGVKAA